METTPAVGKSKRAAVPRKRDVNEQMTSDAALETEMRPSPEELSDMIAQAAYYRASQRNFTPGGELDDWLYAEREILRRYAQ